MVTINSTLEDIMQLDFASREMLLEILQKRQIEERRKEIAKNAKKSVKAYQSGIGERLTADEAIAKLNSAPNLQGEVASFTAKIVAYQAAHFF